MHGTAITAFPYVSPIVTLPPLSPHLDSGDIQERHKDFYHQGTVTIDDLTPSYPPSSVRNVVWTTPFIMTRHLHNTGGGRSTYLPASVKLGLSLTQTNFNLRSAVLTLPASEYPMQRSNHSQSTLMQYANFHLQLRPLTFGAGLALSTKYQTMPNYVI